MKVYFDNPELWTRQKTIGGAAAARICTTRYNVLKNTCSLRREKARVSTEAGAREVFFQEMFDWLDPILA